MGNDQCMYIIEENVFVKETKTSNAKRVALVIQRMDKYGTHSIHSSRHILKKHADRTINNPIWHYRTQIAKYNML